MSTGGKGGTTQAAASANPYVAASQGMQGAYNTVGQAVNQNANASYDPISAATQSAAPTLASAMQKYTNPYENQVVQTMTRDANRQLGQMQTQNAAAADAAGAFGGSRHGLVEAETNAQVNNNLQANVANLRQQGFNTAAQLGGQDVANTLGVRSANQNALNAANQFNAQMGQQAGQNQFSNALNGANTLGNLAQAGFGMGSSLTQQQANQGALSQQLVQSLLTQGQGMYGQYTSQPQQILQMRLAALGVNPLNNATTTTGTQSTPNTLGANLLSAAGNMFQFAPIALSSVKFKKNVKATGKFYITESGDMVPQIEFSYAGSDKKELGVLAESLNSNDTALVTKDGVPLAVDYSKLTLYGGAA